MSTLQPEASSRAKTPRKAAARGKWSEEQLLTSEKSVLIDLDLVKLLSQPQAWNCLEETEKQEILALLPPDVHPDAQAAADDSNSKIPPIPDSFIRYSNNWRDGIRQFQLDLENGRYDPEWLQQAQDAREQRERGDFDKFKEREFEAFWGQKQKVPDGALAGESARVKLGTLIREGVILLGDIWRFHYVYGRGPGKIVIEKEARIDGINGSKLTFAVPPGERVFLHRSLVKDQKQEMPKKEQADVKPDPETQSKPTIAPSDQQEIKPAEPAPEVTDSVKDKDEEMKDVNGLELQEVPASSNGVLETDVNMASQEIPSSSNADFMAVNASSEISPPASNGVEMQTNNETETDTGLKDSTVDQDQEDLDFSVVIVSPQKMKRPIPPPDPQPPVKRKRGRPRKNPLPVHPEAAHELEIQPEPELSQKNQAKPAPPVSSLSILAAEIEKNNKAAAAPSPLDILAAEIEKNNKAAAESSQPEPTENELSTVSSPLSETPPSPEEAEELPSIPIQDEVAVSTEKPDTLLIATEALTEKPIEIDAVDSNGPIETITKADQAGSNEYTETSTKNEQDEAPPTTAERQSESAAIPSQFPTNEMGEIILTDMPSPQALVLKILAIDGRMPNGRTANAWKEFRCHRNNQDMGSLFDLREAWFVQQ